ncbi:aquaporin-like protein [Podospora conica]|nr:aquaporin-like protein [Schizothecium conicum]
MPPHEKMPPLPSATVRRRSASHDTPPPPPEPEYRLAAIEGTFAPDARPSTPRTTPWFRDRAYYLDGWTDQAIWRATLVETAGTAILVLIGGELSATIIGYNTPQIGAYIGISTMLLLTTFIYATAPASGGHLNPLVSFATMLTGLCPVPRAVLYMCGQTTGAALAAGVLTGVWGKERSILLKGGGCFFDRATLSQGQAVLNEAAICFGVLFLAFGIGLDPRAALLFGPRYGPMMVGVAMGVIAFATSGAVPGYTGAAMNPARCFASGIVRRDMSDQWIWWVGPAAAALLYAALFNTVPPQLMTPKGEGAAKKEGESLA